MARYQPKEGFPHNVGVSHIKSGIYPYGTGWSFYKHLKGFSVFGVFETKEEAQKEAKKYTHEIPSTDI